MSDTTPTPRIVMLQSLGSAAPRLAALLEGLPAAAADWQAGPDQWSARQVVTHLAAAEAPFLERLRRVATEGKPWLPYFGPEVARPNSAASLAEALAGFQGGRERLLAFLADLALEDWERPAVHETMGATNMALQVQNLINHDREHLAEVQRVAQLWAEQAHA
ncbi:MAG: DinB family protein [Anaerolineales bacterium]